MSTYGLAWAAAAFPAASYSPDTACGKTELRVRDRENGYARRIQQFIDDKAVKPGSGAHQRPQ